MVNNVIMPSKANSLLMFIGSVGLILIAIVFTSALEKSKSGNASDSTQVNAAKNDLMQFFGVVNAYDQKSKSLMVDDLMFEDSSGKSLGLWTVSVPNSFNFSKFQVGTKIRISASPATFQVSSKTLTANEIVKR